MKLYYAPGVCSIGIHVLLEEIGKPYQLELVNLREGAQFKPPFTGVSPKGKVPALERDDGSVFTEFGTPDLALSWPTVHSHSPVEVIHERDLDGLGTLVRLVAERW